MMAPPLATAQRIASTHIAALTPPHAGQVGEALSESHAAYPAFAHLFPHAARRTHVLRVWFSDTARDALAFGVADGVFAGERLLGAALWLPPGRFPWSPARKLRATPALFTVFSASPRAFPAFAALGSNAERAFPKGALWHLEVLGIRPEIQAAGLGRRLLEHGLTRVDAAGAACYLTTSKGANVAFYERFGFRLEGEHQLIPAGPPHYAMRRPPQA